MWAAIAKIAANLFDFAKGTKKNSEDIKRLNQQVADLTNLLLTLTARFEHSRELSEVERKNLMLELENILLRNGIKIPERGPQSPSLGQSDDKSASE